MPSEGPLSRTQEHRMPSECALSRTLEHRMPSESALSQTQVKDECRKQMEHKAEETWRQTRGGILRENALPHVPGPVPSCRSGQPRRRGRLLPPRPSAQTKPAPSTSATRASLRWGMTRASSSCSMGVIRCLLLLVLLLLLGTLLLHLAVCSSLLAAATPACTALLLLLLAAVQTMTNYIVASALR